MLGHQPPYNAVIIAEAYKNLLMQTKVSVPSTTSKAKPANIFYNKTANTAEKKLKPANCAKRSKAF
jgi:hypothetical protein